MTRLAVYGAVSGELVLNTTDPVAIDRHLGRVGVRFERHDIAPPATPVDTRAVLRDHAPIMLSQVLQHSYQSADVVTIPRGHPGGSEQRGKFLAEHTHSEDEARLMVEGEGAFYLHVDDKVHVVVTSVGDLISVPAQVKHWFDMGPDPMFTAIRFFTRPDGWVAQFTGDDIAHRLPKLESLP